MTPVWERLRERKVVQWAAAYLAGGWVLAQALGLLADAFGWPDQILQIIIVLLFVGFFAALVIGYYHGERGEQRVRPPELAMLGILALIAAPLVYFVSRPDAADALAPVPPPAVTAKSIAVLPFHTITSDAESSAFAAGVQDAVLTLLAKVGDLKVISRTSTEQYAGRERDIPTIGKALGVRTILEASVQRANNKIRVQAQLIDARNEGHLWAHEYNGDLTDLFAIQSEIATQIATELKAHLTADERSTISSAPSANATAYDAYISANEYAARPGNLKENLDAAAALYRRAIRLDPDFAHAYAGLSHVEGAYHWFNRDTNPKHRILQREAADTALALAPDLPEAHRAKALALYWGDLDYAGALREFEIARAGLPNDAALLYWQAAINRRQNKWAEAEAMMIDALATDPRNPTTWAQLCSVQYYRHATDRAVASCARSLEIAPTNYNAADWSWHAHLRHTGTIDELRRVLADPLLAHTTDNSRTFDQFWLAYFSRDAKAGLAVAARHPEGFVSQMEFVPSHLAAAWLYDLAADTRRARIYYDSARIAADDAIRKDGSDARFQMAAAYAAAGLGRREETERFIRRALELMPTSRDYLTGTVQLTLAALAYARVGMNDEAIRILQRNVGIPAGPSSGELKIHPGFDKLRTDPRFQKLLKAKL